MFFRAGHVTCSDHTLDGGALSRAPLRLLDLESLRSGRSDWLYQVRPRFSSSQYTHNFRPVSVLTPISKIYEKVLSEQLSAYFDKIFDQYLCALRKGHGYLDIFEEVTFRKLLGYY